jgi:diadenosine tetraphosphate (Ap4A) HIT family hydrolase
MIDQKSNSDLVFTLDSRLENDTHSIGYLGLCQILLMDDARFPWLILVPTKPNLSEIIDLSEDEQALLMREISQCSLALKSLFSPDKLNIAALGNQVNQLHVHIIARFVSDEAWPNPVWGRGERQSYPPHMSGSLVDRIEKCLRRLV